MKGFLLFFLFVPCICVAQTPEILKVANEVSETDLKANVYKLAAPEMEGRQAGSHGDTLASEFIAAWFKKQQLLTPFDKGSGFIQPVSMQRMQLTKGEINTANKRYRQFDDWYVFAANTEKSVRLDSLPVVFAGYGIESDKYNDLLGIDVKDKAVIIIQVRPSDNLVDMLSSATRSSISADYQKNLLEKGAAAVLVATEDFERSSRAMKNAGSLRTYRNPANSVNSLPRIYVSEKMINDLLLQNDVSLQSLIINIKRINRPLSFLTKSKISINLQLDSIKEQAPNVIGVARGKDTAAAPVIITSHHDHFGERGKQVFYGATDNASGTAVLMEMAKLVQKAAHMGLRPKRSIIFASFTGKESGLLGSYYYNQHPVSPDRKTWAAINLDKLGAVDSFYAGKSTDSNYIYFFSRDTLGHGLENALVAANESAKLQLDERYHQAEASNRQLGVSDMYPFYLNDVPLLQLGSGLPKNYNPLTDTPDKINYSLLAVQAKLAFLALWNVANN